MSRLSELKKDPTRPVLVADQQGTVTFVNAAFTRTLGWEAEEILGEPITTIIPERMRERHRNGFARFLMTGQASMFDKPLKLPTLTKDGQEFNAEHQITAEQQDGQWVFGTLIRPLTS